MLWLCLALVFLFFWLDWSKPRSAYRWETILSLSLKEFIKSWLDLGFESHLLYWRSKCLSGDLLLKEMVLLLPVWWINENNFWSCLDTYSTLLACSTCLKTASPLPEVVAHARSNLTSIQSRVSKHLNHTGREQWLLLMIQNFAHGYCLCYTVQCSCSFFSFMMDWFYSSLVCYLHEEQKKVLTKKKTGKCTDFFGFLFKVA